MQNFVSNFKGSAEASGGPEAQEVPWWMKYAGKGAGIVAGIVAIIFGVVTAISFNPICIVAGILQILAGFVVIVIEAPFCCMFLDFVQQLSGMVEQRPVWQKAALYLVLTFPPLLLCFKYTTILGSGAIFVVAVLFGLSTLGKKASRQDMAAAAAAPTSAAQPTQKSDNMKSGLVGNIHGQDVEAAKQ